MSKRWSSCVFFKLSEPAAGSLSPGRPSGICSITGNRRGFFALDAGDRSPPDPGSPDRRIHCAFFDWHAIFAVVAFFSALCLAAVYRYLPETKEPNPNVRLDKTLGIYLNILRDKEFLGFTLAGGLAQAGMCAYITGSPFVFIELFGVHAENYGWVFGSNAAGLIAFSQINARLVRRHHPTEILWVCLLATALLGAILILAGFLNLGLWGVVVPIFLYISSLGMIFPNPMAGALAEQTENAGSASALIGSLQYGLAAVFSFLVSHFNNGTSLPMTILMGIGGIASFLIFSLLIRPGREPKFIVSEEHSTFG